MSEWRGDASILFYSSRLAHYSILEWWLGARYSRLFKNSIQNHGLGDRHKQFPCAEAKCLTRLNPLSIYSQHVPVWVLRSHGYVMAMLDRLLACIWLMICSFMPRFGSVVTSGLGYLEWYSRTHCYDPVHSIPFKLHSSLFYS